MSGHSKWANIRRAKAITDSKRGKIFTKLARNIILAAQQGGGDPGMNFSLRLAIDRAKSANVPSDNIERAIKRGTGEAGSDNITTITYEAYGPGAIPMLIDCQTDNTNRALNEVREIIDRRGGKMSPSNSVSWQFSEKGVVVLKAQVFTPSGKFGKEGTYKPIETEQMELDLIEVPGVEDIRQNGKDEGVDVVEVIIEREKFSQAHNLIVAKGYKVEVAELSKIPKEETVVDDETWAKLEEMVDALEDSEEVTNVWHNASHD